MKRILLPILQAAITLILLWWIFSDEEKREMMWLTLQTANWWWFVPGLVAIGVTTVLQTFRWQWLLQVQDIRLSFRRAYGINLIGMFFNLFLPGGTGGDLVKMYYATREAKGKRAAAVLSVFMDRVIGLLALITVAALISVMALTQLWDSATMRGLLITLGLIVLGAFGFVFSIFVIEYFHLAKRLPGWLPFRHTLLEVAASFSTYARSPATLLWTFAISLPTHLVIFFSFYCAARALTDELTLIGLFTVLPVILTIAALPISVAGLGVREQLFKVCLGALFGLAGGVAVLIGFTGFLLSVIWGAVGGIIYIFYRPSDHVHPSLAEMEEDVVKIEERIEKEIE